MQTLVKPSPQSVSVTPALYCGLKTFSGGKLGQLLGQPCLFPTSQSWLMPNVQCLKSWVFFSYIFPVFGCFGCEDHLVPVTSWWPETEEN